LDFDFSETKIEVNEEFKPIKISKYTRNFAHKIIEEFMIIANEAI
jgi:ribonuclease R